MFFGVDKIVPEVTHRRGGEDEPFCDTEFDFQRPKFFFDTNDNSKQFIVNTPKYIQEIRIEKCR